MKRTALYI